ncbi:MAG TPA: DUF2600 family protein [Solirubrobacteraceae bacterium]|nr:DUF2600 family protein [Solirubrobacteraceae bacterium]
MQANARYWTTVAPVVRARLGHWERHAGKTPDPLLRALALSKLRRERFNVEAAATLATLVKPRWRRTAVETIVALQVMYDYLDILTEQPLPDPILDGHCLLEALTEAVTPSEAPSGDYCHNHPGAPDGGYLQELVVTVRDGLAGLPASAELTEVLAQAAARCAQAQCYVHATPRLGNAELESWATGQVLGSGLWWPELLAGASASVLALHALIAAAADEGMTHQEAERLDDAYVLIGALTMLDSLVDFEHDVPAGQLNYIELYESPELMATRLASVTREAARKARALPHAAHHIMTLVGVVAYYLSAPKANDAQAIQVARAVREELRPLMTPVLAVMRAWRIAKRLRAAWL